MRDYLIVLVVAFTVAYAADNYLYKGAYAGKLFVSLSAVFSPIIHYLW